MRGRASERLHGECINAAFQGFFERQSLLNEQVLEGLGIVIDDEFNFLLSHWHASTLNRESFLKTSSGFIIYGAFEQNLPVGLVAIFKNDLRMFLHRSSLKRGGVQWSKEAAVIDQRNNLFYLLELARKDDQESTLDPKSNSDTSRYDRMRVQWRVKIVERCILKQDGTLAVASKLIKRYDKRLELSRSDYTVRQQNLISLLGSALGNSFQEASFASPLCYLRKMAQNDSRIELDQWRERAEEEQLMQVYLQNGKKNEKRLGLTFSLSYDYLKSLGTYSQEGKLNGLGLQYRKNGDSLVGVFREDILTKEYKQNQANSKNISTFTMRQLAMQQHLKSLNYLHNTIYLPEVTAITTVSSKIQKYVQAFQREYEKRNVNYNETPSSQSIASETMNIYKYVDLRRKEEELSASRGNIIERQMKKPGFILNKSSKKSVDLSPLKAKTPENTEKSPLRNVRIIGKIYHESQRTLSHRSPSHQLTRLKLNEETYRQRANY